MAGDIRFGDAWRKAVASYPRSRAVPIRFADIDMFRHLGDACISVADTVIVAVAGEGRGELPAAVRAHLRSLMIDVDRRQIRSMTMAGAMPPAAHMVTRP
ncbi:hypothetical protein [Sphingopyxis panaciterrulae]|jgi:hypothetical protein|uniref:Uncharacterized protein n=1 Tax=Sphingopyxis panaciterrulae TaxID=462372 RepID=A0A7W9B5M6_9SPHN|nr:hypothetical protein [Sphingopyxis panaciterrulae]MBB5706697.1 hypothetical protein [Sphingopyxis panaciterrulae]